jgi:hypothetical protein
VILITILFASAYANSSSENVEIKAAESDYHDYDYEPIDRPITRRPTRRPIRPVPKELPQFTSDGFLINYSKVT